MSEPEKKYWDSSCFICFLNKGEDHRRAICEDVLRQARDGNIEIWTSTWTIAEVVRPKRAGTQPLPDWAVKAIGLLEKDHPKIKGEMEALWKRYQVGNPAVKLTPAQIDIISKMFQWDFIKKIDLDERVGTKAVEIARDYQLKPPDAVHFASAIIAKTPVFQAWDRDFDSINHLVRVEEPQFISAQQPLFNGMSLESPIPDDFDLPESVEKPDFTRPEVVAAAVSSPEPTEPPVLEAPSSEPPPTS